METTPLLDCAGRLRSPATTSSFHRGLAPRNKGVRYPADPPTVEEIVAVMRAAGEGPEGVRLRGIIVVLWRAGLRISEALALNETDLDPERGSLLVRHGKGDKRRDRSRARDPLLRPGHAPPAASTRALQAGVPATANRVPDRVHGPLAGHQTPRRRTQSRAP
jgi:integrase